MYLPNMDNKVKQRNPLNIHSTTPLPDKALALNSMKRRRRFVTVDESDSKRGRESESFMKNMYGITLEDMPGARQPVSGKTSSGTYNKLAERGRYPPRPEYKTISQSEKASAMSGSGLEVLDALRGKLDSKLKAEKPKEIRTAVHKEKRANPPKYNKVLTHDREKAKSGTLDGEKNVNGTKAESMMKMCATLLRKVMTHKYAKVFNEPVDVVKLGLPDYYKVITRPMDLGSVKRKLDCGRAYKSPLEFAEDVQLTFRNAMKYNPVGHEVHCMAKMLNRMFEIGWQSIQEKIDIEEHAKCLQEDTAGREREKVQPMQWEKKKRKRVLEVEHRDEEEIIDIDDHEPLVFPRVIIEKDSSSSSESETESLSSDGESESSSSVSECKDESETESSSSEESSDSDSEDEEEQDFEKV